MEKWVLLKDFLSDEARYDKLTRKFINYQPDIKEITFPKEKTGWRTDQNARTESEITWHVFKDEKDMCYVISAETTKFQLGLEGMKGRQSSRSLITEYIETLYGCDRMNAKGIGITVPFYKKFPKNIKELNTRYWISDTSYDEDDFGYYEVVTIWGGNVHPCMLYCDIGEDYSGIFPIRPCVQLPENTFVNVGDRYYNGSTPERALKIKI